jgi:hypothetical protein
MRVVSRRDFAITLSGMSVRRVMSDVMLVIVDRCEAPVRLISMERISTSMPGQWCWKGLTTWLWGYKLHGMG